MKKKSTSQSAFFNIRVLIGVFVLLAGVFLALAGLGTFSAVAVPPRSAQAQQKHKIINIQGLPPGFDCAKIHELGIDKMEGLKWGLLMLKCGEGTVGTPSTAFSELVQKLLPPSLAPLAYGAADVDLVTGAETFPNTTQSETMVAANPDNANQILIGFNDSRGANSSNFSGASFSSDGGTTFTRITNASGNSPFTLTFGDPVVLYNKPSGTWFTVWLDGNSPCTLGGYKSTNPSDPNSWSHFCVHPSGADDRPSGWADNNPSSPHFGNMYVSWNDFGVGAGALVVSRSTDNGVTWSSEITVDNSGTFIRNVQITGDFNNGDVYIAGMDEGGGGFPHNDTNLFFKSTDGGATWTNTYTGSPFPGPGVTACSCNSYFSCMFPDNGGYWRHEGWGQPAVLNGVVSYVYDQHGTGADPADVYYIRSTDGGVTFSAPLKLNSDSGTRPNWQPNLSVSPAGTLFTVWYDARESTSCTEGNPAVPCYRMWANKSHDNGVTWQGDDMFSDVVTPLPAEQDPNIFSCYAGDYDYGFALLQRHMTAWDDGRNVISGQSQQDAFTDRELVGFSVTSTIPACNSLINTQPTDFTINLSDAADTTTVQATDFTVNGTPANSFTLMNSNQQIIFHFNSTPVVVGSNTMHIPAGAILRASDEMPIFEFMCNFCYAPTPLQVTTTNPPVGGTFSPPAPGTYTYDVNWNQAVDPASVTIADLSLSGNTGATVTNVQVINGNTTTEFTLNIPFGGSLTANIAAGAITAQGCIPNAAFSGSYTVLGCPPSQYVITPGTDTIVPGTTDAGNHCDDCDTMISLPFSFTLYDQTYNAVSVDSNGRLDFVCQNDPVGYSPTCLPATPNICSFDFTIFPFWTDLRTDVGLSGCSTWTNGCGVFTSISGTAPNRIFNIEWHAVLYINNADAVDFEARLYENDPTLKFEIIYGNMNTVGNYVQMVGGVQGNSGSGFFTQDFCLPSTGTPPQNVSRTYQIPVCTPSPTPTPTATATATPAPRQTPTPRPRPTPPPRP